MRPILALNCLLQIEQERSEEESSVGDALTLAFRCARFCCARAETRLYIIDETPDIAATILNGDLSNISDWADFWLVNLNAAKTLSMVISRKVNKPIHPPLRG